MKNYNPASLKVIHQSLQEVTSPTLTLPVHSYFLGQVLVFIFVKFTCANSLKKLNADIFL